MIIFVVRLTRILISMMVWHFWIGDKVGSVYFTLANHSFNMLSNILDCFRNHDFCEIIQILKETQENKF